MKEIETTEKKHTIISTISILGQIVLIHNINLNEFYSVSIIESEITFQGKYRHDLLIMFEDILNKRCTERIYENTIFYEIETEEKICGCHLHIVLTKQK